MDTTIEKQVQCVERELRLRMRVYPKFVADGRISAKKADEEQILMGAVLETLKRVRDAEGVQTLFEFEAVEG